MTASAASSSQTGYRRIFREHHGDGPWPCYFLRGCKHGGTVEDIGGLTSDSLVVHHKNGDSLDDQPGNLVAAHRGCHQAYHVGLRHDESRLPDGRSGRALTTVVAGSKKGWASRRASMTDAEWLAHCRAAGQANAARSAEALSATSRKAWETRRRNGNQACCVLCRQTIGLQNLSRHQAAHTREAERSTRRAA